MQSFNGWWQQRSKAETIALTVTCYVLIALGSLDIGAAIYHALN